MFAALLAVACTRALAAESVPDLPPPQAPSSSPGLDALEEYRQRTRVQTFAPKESLKMGHVEVMVQGGTVLGDPFVNRWLAGGTVAWHLSEIAAVSTTVHFSPDLAELDWTPTTRQLIEQNQVAPELSRIQLIATGDLQFTPIYGKVAAGAQIVRFDLYGTVGLGALRTVDDLQLSDLERDPIAQATSSQWHPGLGAGGGLRIWMSRLATARLDARSHSYIEVIDGTALTMKNVAAVTAGVSLLACAARHKADCVPDPPLRAGRH